MGIYTRSLSLVLLILILGASDAFAQKKKKKKKKSATTEALVLNNNIDSVAYAIGMGMSKNLKSSGMDTINYAAFEDGFKAIFNGDSTKISEDHVQVLLNDYFQKLKEEMVAKQQEEGLKFLAENKLRPEVDTTISGLQYEVITPGSGPKPTATSQVTVHYEGKLLNGNIFDSSYEKNKEIQFNLGQVIPGWTEGLQLMSAGAKYIFYIPPHLAYGDRGAGADIPPNSTLIFTVELLSIDN